MSPETELVHRHFDALLEDSRKASIPDDVVGRALLNRIVTLFLAERSVEDVARELMFVAENLDPDTDFTFMRP